MVLLILILFVFFILMLFLASTAENAAEESFLFCSWLLWETTLVDWRLSRAMRGFSLLNFNKFAHFVSVLIV